MIKANTPIVVHYDNGDFNAFLTTFDAVPEKHRLLLFGELLTREPTFTVKFVEKNEVSFDVVTLDQVKFQVYTPLYFQLLGNPQPPSVILATYFRINDEFTKSVVDGDPLVQELLQQRPADGNLLGYFPGVPSPSSSTLYANTFAGDFCCFVDTNHAIVKLGQTCYSYLQPQRPFQLQRIVYCRTYAGQAYILACGVARTQEREHPVVFPLATVTVCDAKLEIRASAVLHGELAGLLFPDGQIELEKPFELVQNFQFGIQYVWLDGLFLNKKFHTLAPATPIEILLAQVAFGQNVFSELKTGKEVKLKHYKYSAQLYHTFMLAEKQELFAPADYHALMEKLFSEMRRIKAMEQSTVRLTNASYEQLHKYACSETSLTCAFCGNQIEYKELVGPYLHSLLSPHADCPVGRPILVAFHRNCAKYVPEADCQVKEEKVDEQFELSGDVLIDLAICDRRMRRAALLAENEVFLNLRMALANERIGNKCSVCGKPGGVIGCWNNDCKFTAHYDCVIEQGLKFTSKKVLFCKKHQK